MTKDFLNKKNFATQEYLRALYKSLTQDQTIPQHIRYAFHLQLNSLQKKASSVRMQYICVRSGRTKGVLRQFKMSRICIRELMAMGALAGVLKSSW